MNIPRHELARMRGSNLTDLDSVWIPPLILQGLQVPAGPTTDIQYFPLPPPWQGMTSLQLSQCLVSPYQNAPHMTPPSSRFIRWIPIIVLQHPSLDPCRKPFGLLLKLRPGFHLHRRVIDRWIIGTEQLFRGTGIQIDQPTLATTNNGEFVFRHLQQKIPLSNDHIGLLGLTEVTDHQLHIRV